MFFLVFPCSLMAFPWMFKREGFANIPSKCPLPPKQILPLSIFSVSAPEVDGVFIEISACRTGPIPMVALASDMTVIVYELLSMAFDGNGNECCWICPMRVSFWLRLKFSSQNRGV